MALVKAGWLWRQSTILRRWKRNWFVLWMDGTLGYYKDDSLQEEEERVLIRYNCREVKTGEECPEMQLPEGQTRDGLLIVFLRDGPRLTLCADSKDEALAWKITILEYSTPRRRRTLGSIPRWSFQAQPRGSFVVRTWNSRVGWPLIWVRRLMVRIYDPYDDYYQIVPPNAHDATYIRTGTPYGAPGVTHVILRDSPYYGRDTGGDIAMGMLAGAATGAALGSLMWMPCWF
ncbi:pleckstrin homology domain-containing family B member 1 isoform X1 [Monodelphis domestica]|uniref:pleckstrin homology domain-containing family B member 1 isoform X1 n=1 Tax=Monodelphis domestica TaxID=13616 RepID=UPI0024E1D148|nr:pleckstrin homology domain-containing family B member 1 isoform X1 [Monodelphis domestica]XP_056650976.1 pleckstrin homology domain-containing family B member 1 isoform X1 [Monodelphis domestica]